MKRLVLALAGLLAVAASAGMRPAARAVLTGDIEVDL